jgi:signal transduction histidine kinase
MKQGLLCLIHIGEDRELHQKAEALREELDADVNTIWLEASQLNSYDFGTFLPFIICVISNSKIEWQNEVNLIKSEFPHFIFGVFSDDITSIQAYASGCQFVLNSDDKSASQYLWQIIASKHLDLENQILENQRLEKSLAEIQSKNKELEKINFELDRFVYSASHDLRSPLTSILGLLYLLRTQLVDAETIKYTNLMEESILKLDNTIKDIVTYSRNNRTEIIREKVKLKSIIKDLVDNLRYLEPYGTSLEESIEFKGVNIINADKGRLQTILNNLISNSIRYRQTSKPLKIVIKSEIENEKVIISVEDNGIGIKEQHIERIFDMFYRTHESSTGSGLGLYIVKETINKLGGSIQVYSTYNEGTTFIVSFPLNN